MASSSLKYLKPTPRGFFERYFSIYALCDPQSTRNYLKCQYFLSPG
jgi:hypothetical protein